MYGHLYVIAVVLIYHSDYKACSCYFRLSVYAWGIFLAYIRCRLSSRLRFPVFWEAAYDKLQRSMIMGGGDARDCSFNIGKSRFAE